MERVHSQFGVLTQDEATRISNQETFDKRNVIPNIERNSSAIKSKEEYKNKRPLTDSEGEFDEQKFELDNEISLSPTAPDFPANYLRKTCATSKSKTTPFGFMEEQRSSDTERMQTDQEDEEEDTQFLGFGSK